jgi:hypothetical protein
MKTKKRNRKRKNSKKQIQKYKIKKTRFHVKRRKYKGGDFENCKIVVINENKLMSSKSVQFKYKESYDEDIQYTFGRNTVFFFLEKLTEENFSFWESFAENQKKNLESKDGIGSFLETLKMFQNGQRDIFIAFVSNSKETNTTIYSNESNIHIEMCFSVFANNSSPIVTHMGIFRSYLYLDPRLSPHINLSVELHAFSGTAINILFPNTKAVVTEPAYMMANILFQSFKESNSFWYGSQSDKNKHKNGLQTFLRSVQKKYPELIKIFEDNIDVPSPLNDLDANTWSLTLNGETTFFSIPHWFQEKTKHPHLQFRLQKIIVSINGLKTVWFKDCNLI